MIFAQNLDLPIQPSQEKCETETLNAKHNKLSVDGVKILHPNNMKENWNTESEYPPIIVLKNIGEYAELNSAKKASKEGRNVLFSGHVMSVKFNLIKSDVSFCQKDWKELAEATTGTTSVLQFIQTTFSNTSVKTPMTS